MSLRYKIGLVVLLVVLGTTALYLPSWWQKYRVDRAISDLERPYREDVYGGKTPEETFDMLLGALKRGDLAATSKFFVLDKQEEYLAKFEKMNEDGSMAKKITEWEGARKEWTKVVDTYNNWKTHATVRYKYEQLKSIEIFDKLSNKKEILPAGIYTSEIIFDLNELANVWKITLL